MFIELIAILLLSKFMLACEDRVIASIAEIVDPLIDKALLVEPALTTAGSIKPCKPYKEVSRTVSSANC